MSIVAVVFYIAIARLTEVVRLNIVVASVLVVAIPEAFRLLLMYIMSPSIDVSPLGQIGVAGVIKLTLQFTVMCVTFAVMRNREEEIVSWWVVLIAGMAMSIVAIPFFTAMIG